MENGTLTNDKTSASISRTDEALNVVPDIIFSDIPQHRKIMELLLQDIQRGNHLLLVENRGLENKKIADRLLQHLNRPTEYTQLHRYTTVHSLTIHPTAKNGTVIYEDSPLVKAVKYGYLLVVDEADKAPTTVTSILNTLIENGEMVLSDGRRMISRKKINSSGGKPSGIIPVHDDFRMIIMTSQTGFPFLDQDFSTPSGLEDRGVHNASSRSRRRRQVSSSTSHEIGITVKAVGSNPAITTVVMGADGTGPHTATAIASGTAVATATAVTYGTGTSTATAIANVSAIATATAHSYNTAVATATASAQDSSSAEATAHAHDKAVATATANASDSKVVMAKAIAKGDQVITDTQTGLST
ncbi:unnamed protein product [Parnassius mnemosyne]